MLIVPELAEIFDLSLGSWDSTTSLSASSWGPSNGLSNAATFNKSLLDLEPSMVPHRP